MTRRDLMRLGAVSGIAGIAGLFPFKSAFGDMEPAGSYLRKYDGPIPEPEIYSFKFGAIDAHVIHDGVFVTPPSLFFPQLKPEQTKPLLEANFLATDHITFSINVLVLRRADGIVLIDSGTGNAGAPTTGRLPLGLAKLGIAPEDVSAVVITHAHFDHIGGTVTPDGKPAFPKATVYVPDGEAAFWTGNPDLSKLQLPQSMSADMVASAKRAFDVLGTQLKRAPLGEIMPGIEYVAAPGHTGGHCAVLLKSGDDRMLHVADSIHSFALQFPNPNWGMAADSNPDQARETRARILNRGASERIRLYGYHLPFPGLGHVVREGHGYRWVPQPWTV